jgi:hypothetical protein
VAKGDFGAQVHLSVGRRHAWPLSWLRVTRFDTLESAIVAKPEGFPKASQSRYAKGAAKSRKKKKPRLPFSLEDDKSEQDLVDFAVETLRASGDDFAGQYLCEHATR